MWKKFDNNPTWSFYDYTWTTSSSDICLGQVSSEYFDESYLIRNPSSNLNHTSYYFCSACGEYSFEHDDVEYVRVMCATDIWTKYHMQFKNKKVAVIKAVNKSGLHSFDRYFGDLIFKEEPEIQCPNCGKTVDGYKNFCGYCATKIEKEEKASFCTKCGAALENGLCPTCEQVTYVNTAKKEETPAIPLSKTLLITHWAAAIINLVGIITNIIVALGMSGALKYMYIHIIYGYIAGFIMMLVATPILIVTLKKILAFNKETNQESKNKVPLYFGYFSLITTWLLAIISIFA